MTVAALVAEGLRFRYGAEGVFVLDGIGFEVRRGEVLGVVGANGSGKSTLMRLLAGIARPERGAVRVLGHDVAALGRDVLARRLALVPQRERVSSGLTVRDVVALGRAPHTGWFGVLSSRDERVVAGALERCELAELSHRLFDTLSGGEQKRALVARAIAQEPSVLLLDEPVASLDPGHQVAVCELFAERANDGDVAVVVVLHDLNLAARYCDRLLVLQDGGAWGVDEVSSVLTRERLREVFDVSAHVGECPADGRPYYVALRPRR